MVRAEVATDLDSVEGAQAAATEAASQTREGEGGAEATAAKADSNQSADSPPASEATAGCMKSIEDLHRALDHVIRTSRKKSTVKPPKTLPVLCHAMERVSGAQVPYG